MNILDSKVIITQFENEIYMDDVSNIKLTNFQLPEKSKPYFQCMIGLDMIRIRDNKFYGHKTATFGIRASEGLKSIEIFEPAQESIFAVKNDHEKQAASELIKYILTESASFKQKIEIIIEQIKQKNIVTEADLNDAKAHLDLLKKLSKVQPDEINFALNQKISA